MSSIKKIDKKCVDTKPIKNKLVTNNPADNFFEEQSYSTHNRYEQNGDKKPKCYSKTYRRRKNSCDSSSEEEFSDPCPMKTFKKISKPKYLPNFWNGNEFNGRDFPPFGTPFETPCDPPAFDPTYFPQYDCNCKTIKPCEIEPKSHESKIEPKSSKTEPKSSRTESKSCKTEPKSSKIEPKSSKIETKSGRKTKKCCPKRFYDPKYHLDKALHYYYNQYPNFNTAIKPGAYPRFSYYHNDTPSYYDRCPNYYYDVYNKIINQMNNNNENRYYGSHFSPCQNSKCRNR